MHENFIQNSGQLPSRLHVIIAVIAAHIIHPGGDFLPAGCARVFIYAA